MADGLLGGFLSAAGVGSAIGSAVVQLELNTAKYNAELEAAEGKTIASTGAMGQSTSKYAGFAKAAFLGIGVAAVAGIAVAIKAGSDLNEQINKAGEVFEGSAAKAIAFGKSAASGLGIAESEALEATSNFGQLLEAAGFAADAAEGMSEQMTTLGADLGSFNNIPVAEALEKIRAGLAGQARPLREVGVFLSEARVQAEAYSSGIAEVGTELTDAQKIQARYNIILDDTTKAQGDFQRTLGESLPNQLKVLQAELTNTAADLGMVLLPVALDVLKAFKAIVPVLRFLADHLDLVVTALLGFTAVKFLPGLINSIATATIRMSAAMGASLTAQGAISGGFAAVGDAAGPVTAALIGIGYAIKQIANNSAETAQKVAELTNQLADTKIGVDEYREAVVDAEVGTGHFAARLPQVVNNANEVADAGIGVATALGKAAMAEAETAHQAELLAKTHEVAGKEIKNFANMTDKELKDWAADTKESFDTAILALDETAEQTVITRKEFMQSSRIMRREAEDLSAAMKEIAQSKWVPDAYVKFLSEQGPEWLVGFANLTETQQHRAVQAWRGATEETDKAKGSLDKITGALDKIGGGKSTHTVKIQYEYVGFDPSKPGMSGTEIMHGSQGGRP